MSDAQPHNSRKPQRLFGVALGSNASENIHAAEACIAQAVAQVQKWGGSDLAISAFYRSAAFPAGSGPDYVNAALVGRSDKEPDEILQALHEVEAEMGRVREKRWGQRIIDLDLLFVDDVVLPDPATHRIWRDMALEDQVKETPQTLILPHPRLQDRSFVLVPLAQICADWTHPISGRSVAQMLAARPPLERSDVKRLKPR